MLGAVINRNWYKFLFGCNGFEINPNEQTEYNRRFAEIFNYATLPFYWGSYERVEGKTSARHIERIARWCRRHNIIAKGRAIRLCGIRLFRAGRRSSNSIR